MQVYYNSRDLKYKKPFGCARANEEIRFRLDAQDGEYVFAVYLILTKDGEKDVRYKMAYQGKEDDKSIFELTLSLNEIGLYWYKFYIETEKGSYIFGSSDNGVAQIKGKSYHITIYEKEKFAPTHQHGGVIYQIFADRFNKGEDSACKWQKSGVLKDWTDDVTIVDSDGVFRANDFFGGNLQGIIDKLDYLKDLGVTMIYLTPIFKSSSNHRYDTGDYMQIDELLGDENSLKRLIDTAKEKGIGIMLDGVFNHTGSDSIYFNKNGNYDSLGAYQSKKSPYYNWYTFYQYPDIYECWWGVTVTPTVNETSKTYKKFLLGENGVIEKWTRFGIAGWRLDVVDELNVDTVYEIRKKIKKENEQAYMIGEVWEDASTKIAYSTRRPYLQGKQLDGTMNYPFRNAILDYIRNNDNNIFINNIMNIYENYPLQTLLSSMNFLGTHDTVRALNSFSDYDISKTSKADRLKIRLPKKEREKAIKRLKFASALLYALPGIPTVFYGDEVGLEGYEDPINRRPFPWNNMDMDLLEHYKMLGALHTEYRKFFASKMKIYEKDGLLYIVRYTDDDFIQFIFNNSGVSKTIIVENMKNCVDKQILNGKITLKDKSFIALTKQDE